MKMRLLFILSCISLCLYTTSCSDDPIDSEQYIKEIYLVGAYDNVWPIDVMYSDEPFEAHITVTSSGSLDIKSDVSVELEIDEDMVTSYNDIFLGILNQDKFYKSLDNSLYQIPDLQKVVIEAKKEIYKNVPIFIQTATIDTDESLVIPVKIKSVSEHTVNKSGEKMLVLLKMKNLFDGNYSMKGEKTVGNGTPLIILRNKNLKAISKQSARMYIGADNENIEDLSTKGIILTVDENPIAGKDDEYNVTVKTYDNSSLFFVRGEGTYNATSKEFNVSYTVMQNGSEVTYDETLGLNIKK